MAVHIPRVDWDCDEDVDRLEFAHAVFERGCTDINNLSDLIAYDGVEWQEQDLGEGMGAGWSLRSLFTVAYLKTLGTINKERGSPLLNLDPPPMLRYIDDYSEGGLMRPRYLLEHVKMLAIKWRSLGLDQKTIAYMARLECHLAEHVTNGLWTPPRTPKLFLEVCDIMGMISTSVYIFREIVPQTLVMCPPMVKKSEIDLVAWMTSQVKHATASGISTLVPYMHTLLCPGDDSMYARQNGGIFASNPRDVLEISIPHVSTESILEIAQGVDIQGANGYATMTIVNSAVLATTRLKWIKNNVYRDTDIDSKHLIKKLKYKIHPWIILVAGMWYVISPYDKVTWCMDTALHAIAKWFELFFAQHDLLTEMTDDEENAGSYFDGKNFYSFCSFDITCLRKASFQP